MILVIAAVKEMPESKMGEMVKLFNKFDLSRGAAMEKAFEHQTHHEVRQPFTFV